MNLEAGIWKCVDGEWSVHKRYKGCDWSGIDWSQEGQTGCPYCIQELGGDTSQDNFTVYGLNDEGMVNGGHCWSCNTTIVSSEKAIEDEENKSSTDGKISALTKKSNINSIKEESKVSFASNKLSKDQQKLNDKRLSQEQIDKIHSETSDTLKVGFRGLDKDVCFEMGVRWSYCPSSGKVQEMYVPAHILENGEFVLTGYQVRKVRDNQGNLTKDFYALGSVSKLNTFFGQTLNHKETLVIVGGQVDCISAIQMLRQGLSRYPSRIPVVVSAMCGESSTADFIKTHYEWISKFSKVILALDNDQAGQEAVEKAKEVLNPETTLVATYSLKDANEYLIPKNNKSVSDFSSDVVWNAVPVKSYGIVQSSGLFDKALEMIASPKIPLPPFLSELKTPLAGGIEIGGIVNIVSASSLGKSSIINQAVIYWLKHCPYKMCVFSLEDNGGSYVIKLASNIIGKKLMSIEDDNERYQILKENEQKVLPYLVDENGNSKFVMLEEASTSIEDIERAILQAIKVHGCSIFVIDTLTNVILSKSIEEQAEFMLMEERLRRLYNVTFINLSHTRKLGNNEVMTPSDDMVKGASQIVGTATMNIILTRDKMSDDPIERNTTNISITKNRSTGITGNNLAKIYYDNSSHTLFSYDYASENDFFANGFPNKVDESLSTIVYDEIDNDDAEVVDIPF